MTTLNTMLKRVHGLAETHDLSDWEADFVRSLMSQTRNADDTRSLTEKQIDVLERLFNKHFAG
jgi:hypothetical protein